MRWWTALLRTLHYCVRRARHEVRPGALVHDGFLANVLGALIDLLVQLFVVFLIAAGAVGVLRGPAGDLPPLLLLLVGGLALLALLISRTVRRTYVMGIQHFGLVRVNTASVPYFVLDLGWLVLGAAWLHDAFSDPAPLDPITAIGGSATILWVVAVLLGLRIRSRLRSR